MKTKELIKKVEELGNAVRVEFVNKNALLFTDNGQTLICQVDDDIISTYKDRFAINSPISKAIELMFEYAKTPLEEREEPKMYRLLMPNAIMLPGLNTGYLIKQHGFNIIVSEKGIKDDLWTQKEIDEIPDNIRNFFIKEEV